jgi:hypothetical protein
MTTVHVPTARPSTPEEISHARTAQTRPECSQTRQPRLASRTASVPTLIHVRRPVSF